MKNTRPLAAGLAVLNVAIGATVGVDYTRVILVPTAVPTTVQHTDTREICKSELRAAVQFSNEVGRGSVWLPPTCYRTITSVQSIWAELNSEGIALAYPTDGAA